MVNNSIMNYLKVLTKKSGGYLEMKTRFSNRAEAWIRENAIDPDYTWTYVAVYDLTIDFIRQFRNKLNWKNEINRKHLLEIYGERFYKEIFGDKK